MGLNLNMESKPIFEGMTFEGIGLFGSCNLFAWYARQNFQVVMTLLEIEPLRVMTFEGDKVKIGLV